VKRRILFVGDFRWNSGSSHVIAQYARVAALRDAEVRVSLEFGSHDAEITRLLPYEADLQWATHLVIVLEGNPFLRPEDMARIGGFIPSARRVVIDADGHSLMHVTVGSDDNHAPAGREAWKEQFDLAEGLTVCPRLLGLNDASMPDGFSYFGMPPIANGAMRKPPATKDCGLRYVGANWWRFDLFVEVVRSFRRVAGHKDRVEVCGRWWDGEIRAGRETATRSSPDVLHDLGVVVRGPVPFGEVVSAMSEAHLSPVLVRPVLSELGLATPRVFETLSADTIPIYLKRDAYLDRAIGGNGVLCLGDNPDEDMERILSDLAGNRAVAAQLRSEMFDMYRYEAVFDRLLGLLP